MGGIIENLITEYTRDMNKNQNEEKEPERERKKRKKERKGKWAIGLEAVIIIIASKIINSIENQSKQYNVLVRHE